MATPPKLYIAGHRGMVGAALMREAARRGYEDVVTATHAEVDLTRQDAVEAFIEAEKPGLVMVAAAKVGGIFPNQEYPAEFMYENLMIAANVIHAAWKSGVERLLFLGSSCIYPREVEQPMPESALLTGPLEVTNEAYALAKIAGLKMCQHYRKQYGVMYHSVMPANLYGPGDNYHPENSHVLAAMIRRFHLAKEQGLDSVVIWGTGKPRREFLHTGDLAAACFALIEHADPPDWVNVGAGADVSILELAQLTAEIVGYEGGIGTDPSKPDGTMLKLMDTTIMNGLGWKPGISLRDGITAAYEEYRAALEEGAVREV